MTTAKKLQSTLANAGGAGLNVEEVFSTYLYTGNGSSQTITNGIDLDGEGGLVWFKARNNAQSHQLFDSERSSYVNRLFTDTDIGEYSTTSGITSVSSDGFSIGSFSEINTGTVTYASWTFRKAPKFFDVVTYTGDGTGAKTINHGLGCKPGFILIKRTDTSQNWICWHKNDGGATSAYTGFSINLTNAVVNTAASQSIVTDTTFKPASIYEASYSYNANASGGTYVAYLFAHNDGDGEFGASGDQDIIKCGSTTLPNTSSGNDVNLGFEPQFILIKNASVTDSWHIFDTMRGIGAYDSSKELQANASNAETDFGNSSYPINITSTGFSFANGYFGWGAASNEFIYIAIRRPMKTPESGTEVFAMDGTRTESSPPAYTSGFPVDMALSRNVGTAWDWYLRTRLTQKNLYPHATYAEDFGIDSNAFQFNDGFHDTAGSDSTNQAWMFKRAPGFFDVVCYTGNDTAGNTINHNLGVAPEFMIVKKRDASDGWVCYHSGLGATKLIALNDYQPAVTTSTIWNDTAPSESVFTLGFSNSVNASGSNFVAYLFASLPGISKVGSYTGNGSSQTIDCGFSTGARFVLIKRANGSGDSADGWYVWDSARGIVSGNDPYLLLNSTDAENTSTDYIDPSSTGFEISSSAPAAINNSGDSFIFLAIA